MPSAIYFLTSSTFKQLTMKIRFLILFLVSTFWGLNAQERVTGLVTDGKTGEALLGVTISVKGTTNGTITDTPGTHPQLLQINPQ